MKYLLSLVMLGITTTVSAKPLNEIDLLSKNQNDVDVRTTTYGIGASRITPFGLLGCSYEKESGESRIDSFNNIFGISSILNNPWHHYEADKKACKYGIKLDVAGGTLKAGIGYRDYQGQTELVAGGKSNHMVGKGLDMTFSKGDKKYRLKHVRKYADIFARFTSYDNLVALNENVTSLSFNNGKYKIVLEDTDGIKRDEFSVPLFASNILAYRYQTLEIGKTLKQDKQSFYLAPVFITGSERGTFNPLETDPAFHGVRLKYKTGKASYAFSVLQSDGSGRRVYLPATNWLEEYKEATRYQLQYECNKWKLKLENARSKHVGSIDIQWEPYQTFAGNPGISDIYHNSRQEDTWKLDLEYKLLKQSVLAIKFTHSDKHDIQYSYAPHDYSEQVAMLGFKTRF